MGGSKGGRMDGRSTDERTHGRRGGSTDEWTYARADDGRKDGRTDGHAGGRSSELDKHNLVPQQISTTSVLFSSSRLFKASHCTVRRRISSVMKKGPAVDERSEFEQEVCKVRGNLIVAEAKARALQNFIVDMETNTSRAFNAASAEIETLRAQLMRPLPPPPTDVTAHCAEAPPPSPPPPPEEEVWAPGEPITTADIAESESSTRITTGPDDKAAEEEKKFKGKNAAFSKSANGIVPKRPSSWKGWKPTPPAVPPPRELRGNEQLDEDDWDSDWQKEQQEEKQDVHQEENSEREDSPPRKRYLTKW